MDPLLKTLQVRPSPPEALVQAYLIHIADRSDTNFRKILDLKGIRKAEQGSLVDLFAAFRAAPSNDAALVQSSPLLTPLQIQSGHIGTGIGSLGNAAAIGTPTLAGGRFDPATFGSALMNAARDGVDRFGSPALGSSATMGAAAGGTGSGQQAEAPSGNLNDNLKNIGKFFRRDMGSFGRFGRPAEEGR